MKIAHKSDYVERRRKEQRPLGDQLDDLWHAMDSGLLPKVPAFYDPIKALKTKYQKPIIDAG